MNPADAKQNAFALVREMMETPEVIRKIDWQAAADMSQKVADKGGLFMTGEGSSRIFPAKNAISLARKLGRSERLMCEGARQAAEYQFDGVPVFGASNSGRTREVIDLFKKLKAVAHPELYGLTATADSALSEVCAQTFVLGCGGEDAVAATKSVVEQTLFYQIMIAGMAGERDWTAPLNELADKVDATLRADVPADMARRIASAEMLYVAGRNNGVAEELALKTCEITRKKSAYCEGTFIVHGIEEVMSPTEAVILIDPYESEWDKFKEVLVDGVGLYVMAVASRETIFPTLVIPDAGEFNTVAQLCAGWNVLAATGLELGIDLDHPTRARKVGNEVSN